jgi:hypothetical protein
MMAVTVDDGLVAAIAANTGAVHLELRDAREATTAVSSMEPARRAVQALAHPEEPEARLASFVSPVEDGPRGPTFWFDVADAEAYDGLIQRLVDDVVAAIEAAGGSGVLGGPVVEREPTRG